VVCPGGSRSSGEGRWLAASGMRELRPPPPPPLPVCLVVVGIWGQYWCEWYHGERGAGVGGVCCGEGG